MGSSRLPGKMMLPLQGIPVVEWVFRRTKSAQSIQNIVFAIPATADNDVLNNYLTGMGANVFRGNEKDVVERFFLAAKEWNASHIVRICADNPFVTGTEIDHLVKFYFEMDCDYAYNHIPRNNRYPDGMGAEIVSFRILQTIHEEAGVDDHREHIFNYIWANPGKFKILTFDPEDERLAQPDIKLDLDTLQDYEKLCSMNVDIEMTAYEIIEQALFKK